jgi:hypothetical protein
MSAIRLRDFSGIPSTSLTPARSDWPFTLLGTSAASILASSFPLNLVVIVSCSIANEVGTVLAMAAALEF